MSRDTLSRDEILSASPSQLNEWIDELMQYKHIAGDCPKWSEDISAAWKVVEKIKSRHDISLHSDNSEKKGYHVMITEYGTVRRLATVFAKTAPLAISRAALLAVME